MGSVVATVAAVAAAVAPVAVVATVAVAAVVRAVVEPAAAVVADSAVAVGGATASSVATADTVVQEVVEEGVPDGLGLGRRLDVMVVVDDGSGSGVDHGRWGGSVEDGCGCGLHDSSNDAGWGGSGSGGRRVMRVVGTLVDDNQSGAWVVVASLLVAVNAGTELGLGLQLHGLDSNGAHGCDNCGLENFNIISKSLRVPVLNKIILTKIS